VRNILFGLSILTVTLGCIPAFAVDGVVLINQSQALAGNVTPGDTPGFPVTLSQAGSYRLTGDLIVPDANTTAIRITADHVTLDLNGFAIVGPTVCTSSPANCPPITQGIGIQADNGPTADGPRGTKILNGTVRGMGSTGIFITGAGSVVERVVVDSNGGGILNAGSVIESSATRNGTFGILATIVRDCYVTDNHDIGIQLDGIGGVATGNIASFNGSHGILSPNGTVSGNTAVRNVAFGISATCPSSIAGNTFVANSGGTINTSGAGCVLFNNATR
jgi:hypothetical protein